MFLQKGKEYAEEQKEGPQQWNQSTSKNRIDKEKVSRNEFVPVGAEQECEEGDVEQHSNQRIDDNGAAGRGIGGANT